MKTFVQLTKIYRIYLKIKLIFWNEISMQRNWDFMIVNRIFFWHLRRWRDCFFWKKKIYFCENFKQCFFVVFKRFRNIIVNMCLQKLFFWNDVKILFLIINMRFRNFSLIEKNRQKIVVFVKNVLNIDNAMNIDENINFASWHHEYLFKINSLQKLINIIYFDLNFIFFSNQYFSERVILAMINIDVQKINEIRVDKFRENVHFKHNFNIFVNFELKNEFDDECFHHYNEISLFFYILRLKIDMSIMILRNLKFLVKCNEIKIRIIRIDERIIKIEIIDDKRNNIKIIISRMSLQFKNDKNNKNRQTNVLCQFIKRQYFIRLIFAMIVNKFQNQSLRYVNIDIKMRYYFNHDQFYVIVFKITNKHNFHIVIFELNVLSNDFSRKIINHQWTKILLNKTRFN